MKKILSISLILAAALAFTSCVKEEEDIFDKSAAERLNEASDLYSKRLMASPNERLKTLCETNDGFKIAQKDLELRGPGDFLGTRQHGDTLIPGMALGADVQMLEESSQCLKWIRSPGYEAEWEQLKESAHVAFANVLDNIAMN